MATEVPVTPFVWFHTLGPEISRCIDQHSDYRGNTNQIREAIARAGSMYPSAKTISDGPVCETTAGLSQVSLNIYLRRTNRSTYVCLCNWWNQPLSFLPLLWRHCYDRPLKYMENWYALTPTQIQLKHPKLTVSTCKRVDGKQHK